MFRKLDKEIPGGYSFLIKKLNFAQQTALNALVSEEISIKLERNPEINSKEATPQKKPEAILEGIDQKDEGFSQKNKEDQKNKKPSEQNNLKKESFLNESQENQNKVKEHQNDQDFLEIQEKIFRDLKEEAWDVSSSFPISKMAILLSFSKQTKVRGLDQLDKALDSDQNLLEFAKKIDEHFSVIENLVKDINYHVSMGSLNIMSTNHP